MRPSGNQNEAVIYLIKPTFNGGEAFLLFNDNYAEQRGPWANFKFDNEDIYACAKWKSKFDPNEDFKDCTPIYGTRHPQGRWAALGFHNDAGLILMMTIMCNRD